MLIKLRSARQQIYLCKKELKYTTQYIYNAFVILLEDSLYFYALNCLTLKYPKNLSVFEFKFYLRMKGGERGREGRRGEGGEGEEEGERKRGGEKGERERGGRERRGVTAVITLSITLILSIQKERQDTYFFLKAIFFTPIDSFHYSMHKNIKVRLLKT